MQSPQRIFSMVKGQAKMRYSYALLQVGWMNTAMKTASLTGRADTIDSTVNIYSRHPLQVSKPIPLSLLNLLLPLN